ncbi:MAG: phosphoesterase [Planctomycetota bacterium]|nr:MAG: phosphoesterase [Planctomycetota bacterium]
MKRIVWLTDIHFNFLSAEQLRNFLAAVSEARPDAVLISGDIGEAHDVCDYLRAITQVVEAPIYFVLGNHDYYFGSIRDTRLRVAHFCEQHERLHYLTTDGVVRLTDRVGLVGHDGWADGRLGDYPRSLVRMHDWKLIGEFKSLDKPARWNVLKQLGDEAAGHLRRVLPQALAKYEEVVVLTHVPPFREACWHEGSISNDDWLPHFTCQATGQVILEMARLYPQRQITVLCGHTHGEGQTQPRPNLYVITGGADYGAPRIARVFEFE